MDKILHDLKDSKLWEFRYITYNEYCRILSISSRIRVSINRLHCSSFVGVPRRMLNMKLVKHEGNTMKFARNLSEVQAWAF